MLRKQYAKKGKVMDKKKVFLIIQSVLCFLVMAYLAVCSLIIYNKGLAAKAADPTAWIYSRELVGKYLLPVLPVAIITIVMALVGIFSGIRDENQDKLVKSIEMKKNPEYDEASEKKKKTILTVIRCVVCVAAITLIVVGIINGSARDTLYKAITICTECVGLG